MKINRVLAFALVGAMAMTGCVSIDSTRAKLNSKDASEVKKGEDAVYWAAAVGRDATGFVSLTTAERIEYVKLTSNQELLIRIIDNSNDGDVIEAALERVDFSKRGVAKEFFLKRFDKLDCIKRYEWNDFGRYYEDVSYKARREWKTKIISQLSESDLLELIGDENRSLTVALLTARLVEATSNVDVLWKMYNGEISCEHEDKNDAMRKLLTMIDKVEDKAVIERLLTEYNNGERLVNTPQQRILLMRKLPEDKMVKLVMKDIEDHDVYKWKNFNLSALETGIGVTAHVKDTRSVAKIVAAVLAKIVEYRKACKDSWTMDWGKGDEEKVKRLMSGLPAIPDAVIATLVCYNESTWKYLIDKVTAESAYNILTKGKAKSAELEEALVKKLPVESIDMKVYEGVKTDVGRKAVLAAMPEELKKSAQESAEKAFESIMEKAKAAAAETFELDGFYLGMSMDDAKMLMMHHFPDVEITEEKDKNGEYKLDASCQDTPFCWADKERKVYQFNFGKQMLKKWYEYNAARTMDWAKAFSRERNIEMKLDFLERSDDVYLPNAMLQMEPHHVSLHQEIWTYKDGMKNYRITYFGERKFGGNGIMIKAAAHDKYMYISAPEGTLRAKVEND